MADRWSEEPRGHERVQGDSSKSLEARIHELAAQSKVTTKAILDMVGRRPVHRLVKEARRDGDVSRRP